MTTNNELLPCPFCGCKRIFVQPDEVGSGGQWVAPIHVGCNDCKAEQQGNDELSASANWNRRQPAMPADAAPILAPKHTGMMVDYTGLIGQARAALNHGEKAPAMSELLRQLAVHMSQLGQRWYAGDAKVVDEFLQLYCIEQDARRRIEGES